MKSTITRWTLAAVTAASLGFGASQALASPREAAEERACNPTGCQRWCQSQGGIRGQCTEEGLCLCAY